MVRAIQTGKKRGKFWDGKVADKVAAQYGLQVPQEEIDAGLSPNQVASILGVTGEAVKQWIFRHRLPAVKLANGYWRVSKPDLERFLRDRCGGVRRKVLVAGLDDDCFECVRKAAGANEMDILAVNSVFDALLKLQEYRPSLCIVDCSSSAFGWGFVEKVRSSRFSQGCPIMVIAGAALGQAELDRAMELEIGACHVKPLAADSFKNDIKRLLSRMV